MFNIAYGLGCDSKDDATLIRMEKLVTASLQAGSPTHFIVVCILLQYMYFECSNFLLECASGLEAPPSLDAWWFIQEVG
jgi:hypothetical protein